MGFQLFESQLLTLPATTIDCHNIIRLVGFPREVDKPDAKSYFSGKTEPYYSEYLLSSTNLQIERKRLINRAF